MATFANAIVVRPGAALDAVAVGLGITAAWLRSR